MSNTGLDKMVSEIHLSPSKRVVELKDLLDGHGTHGPNHIEQQLKKELAEKDEVINELSTQITEVKFNLS